MFSLHTVHYTYKVKLHRKSTFCTQQSLWSFSVSDRRLLFVFMILLSAQDVTKHLTCGNTKFVNRKWNFENDYSFTFSWITTAWVCTALARHFRQMKLAMQFVSKNSIERASFRFDYNFHACSLVWVLKNSG